MRCIIFASALAVTACGGSPSPAAIITPGGSGADSPTFRATIRWTSHGVPHVRADDVGGLGFGQGYAMAKAHLCVMADQFVRVRGQRARWFGAGTDDAHVDSDFANLHLGWRARAEAMVPELSDEARAMLDGFAAGYDRYLAVTPVAARPAACRDAPWLTPVVAADVLAVVLSTSTLASSRFLESQLANAGPGATTGALPDRRTVAAASNAWAIGAERTTSGGGILIGNPHFPWDGDLVFFENHLQGPRGLDVYGATLVGIPGVAIGVTRHHAWSHTFSSSTHMAFYRLALDADSALRYRHGDDIVPIVPTTYTIDVADGGALAQRSRTLYRSSLGPMVVTALTPWDGPGGHAFTVRDVALASAAQLDQPFAMARATSRDQFERALALSGTPFVNTIYADAAGDALYVDGSRVPALSQHGLGAWQLARKLVPAIELAWQRGLVVLDGSNPLFDLEAFDGRAPGAIPIAQAPRLLRRDFVMNANDSYRFTNLDAAEVEYSPLYGEDGARPSPRTLANLALLRPGDPAAGADGRFTLDEAAAAMLSNRSFTAERLGDDVVVACGGTATGAARRPRGKPTPCDVLAAWDGRFDAGSRGAALWRELMVGLARDGAVPWQQGFDRQAPARTPDGLTSDRAAIVSELDAAARRLRAAGVDVGGELGAAQHAPRAGARLPVPGGDELDGVANVVAYREFDASLLPRTPRGPASASGLSAGGYVVNYGSSFILAAELGADGPRAKALFTYGNSSDPASPHYRDQLEAFARGELRPVRFDDAEIAADPTLVTEEIAGP